MNGVQYTAAWQEIVDRLIYQAYYRLLGVVEVLTDFDTLVDKFMYVIRLLGPVVGVVRGRERRSVHRRVAGDS